MSDQTEIIQAKYPSANPDKLAIYFRHLEACAGTQCESGRTHEHHICPKAQFPELEHEPENLITLTIEDHMHAHRLLAAAIPELSRYANPAWIAAQPEGACKGGRKGGRVNASVSGHMAKAGRISGLKHRENGTGVFGRTREQRRADSRIAGAVRALGLTHEHQQAAGRCGGLKSAPLRNHTRWHVNRSIVSPTCSFCEVTA